MKLEQFAMERMQSTYENQVEFNLSESGVQPLRLGELVDDDGGARRADERSAALHAIERYRAAALGDRGAVSGRERRITCR